MMAERVTLDELVEEYRERRREELLPEVDRSSFDLRDEELYESQLFEADRIIDSELRNVTRPPNAVERGFFWGTLGFLLFGLAAPDNQGAAASDLELAMIGGGLGIAVGICVRFFPVARDNRVTTDPGVERSGAVESGSTLALAAGRRSWSGASTMYYI